MLLLVSFASGGLVVKSVLASKGSRKSFSQGFLPNFYQTWLFKEKPQALALTGCSSFEELLFFVASKSVKLFAAHSLSESVRPGVLRFCHALFCKLQPRARLQECLRRPLSLGGFLEADSNSMTSNLWIIAALGSVRQSKPFVARPKPILPFV